jgi:flagellar basal-body rod modification protein FlgD
MAELSISNISESRDDFLRMFVTQLKHQSPLDPLKGHEFVAQLAQFTSLEQLTNLNISFSDMLKFQQLFEGSGLIGRNATYLGTDTDGESQGMIDGVKVSDGEIVALIQSEEIPISDITGVF